MNSIIKRCSIASVLALAVLMPDFRLLKTSPEGLALIADLEGCRLSPYRCSAGVWTSGIGHTAGVVPTRDITERDAAATLVSLINRKHWPQACGELTRWVYVNGNKNAGLENRRAREKAWCLKEGR